MNEATIDIPENPFKGLDKRQILFAFALGRTDNASGSAKEAGYSNNNGSAGVQGNRLRNNPKIIRLVEYLKKINVNTEREFLANDYGMLRGDVDHLRDILNNDFNKPENVNKILKENANNPPDVMANVNEGNVNVKPNVNREKKTFIQSQNETLDPSKLIPATSEDVKAGAKSNDEALRVRLMTTVQTAVFLEEIASVSGINYEVKREDDTIEPKNWSDLTEAEKFCVAYTVLDDKGKVKGYKLRNIDKILEYWIKSKGLLRESENILDDRPAFTGISINMGDGTVAIVPGTNSNTIDVEAKEPIQLPKEQTVVKPSAPFSFKAKTPAFKL